MTGDAVVFVVDDDDAVRAGLKLLLQSEGYTVVDYASAKDFLRECLEDCGCHGCIILDLQMPDMDGLAVQQELAHRGIDIPIIFLSGHGTIPTAVKALKDGAMDFIEKPVDRDRLLDCVRRALQDDAKIQSQAAHRRVTERRLAKLTRRERQIMDMIAAGKPNKVVAIDLGISERTVELHRSRILHKMEVRNAVELTQILSSIGEPQR